MVQESEAFSTVPLASAETTESEVAFAYQNHVAWLDDRGFFFARLKVFPSTVRVIV